MSHISVNFDRTGYQQDLNMVFPIERLNEMTAEKVIGSVADYNYLFMGATDPAEMAPLVRKIAGFLKEDHVNAVLLAPICPNCTRAVGAHAHYLEEAGLATTQISLVRPHTERIRPPRELWVSFELGRPFGAPGDPAFQRWLIGKALGLLEWKDGPVLEGFPEDAPASADTGDGSGWVCPVTLGASAGADAAPGSMAEAVAAEMQQLRP